MNGLTHTLDIARRALMTQQSVLSVIAHNISNANSPGYSRQVARLEAEVPQRLAGKDWGNGVTMAGIERRRDLYLDQRVRAELGSQNAWSTRAGVLGTVEETLNEPSDTGLGATLDDYFAAWSELSASPEDVALRANVVAHGQILAQRIRDLDGSLVRTSGEIENQIDIELGAFNQKLASLQSLTERIVSAELSGTRANDLRDQRDMILDDLAESADIRWVEQQDGTVVVRVGGRVVLDSGSMEGLQPEDLTAEIESGALGALIALRDETLPDMRAGLDVLARDLMTQVNALHRAGPSGIDFFTGTGAVDMEVDATLVNDITALNVSSSGLSGDNDIALAMAGLQQARIIDRLSMTPSEYWSTFVSRLGTQAEEANFQQQNAQMTAEAMVARRESVKGVSLDEEMAEMIRTQEAYQAAARLFDTAAKMLDTLLQI
jgi:flagellar hook-associated protein 1 FlgK